MPIHLPTTGEHRSYQNHTSKSGKTALDWGGKKKKSNNCMKHVHNTNSWMFVLAIQNYRLFIIRTCLDELPNLFSDQLKTRKSSAVYKVPPFLPNLASDNSHPPARSTPPHTIATNQRDWRLTHARSQPIAFAAHTGSQGNVRLWGKHHLLSSAYMTAQIAMIGSCCYNREGG